MTKLWMTGVLLAGTALVGACGKKAPEGQVVAVVNGQEVTLQEVNTELREANVPESADKQAAQRALLQRVIERKLLVGAAEEKKLDQSPDYLATKRRADELLLAQAYAKQQLAAIPVPTESDVGKFMTDNASAFAKREQLALDQIRFATQPSPAVQKQLQGAHTLDAVAAVLTAANIKFERGRAGLDTAQLPPKVMQQINALPAGEPFVIPANGVVTVSVITERRPVAVDTARARPAAVQAWRQQRYLEMLNKQLEGLKKTAKITYQPGFDPKDKAAPAPKPAA